MPGPSSTVSGATRSMESLFQLVTGLMAPPSHTHYVFPSLKDCGGECSTTCPPYRSHRSHAVSGAAFRIPVEICHTIANVLNNSFKSTSLTFDDLVILGSSLDNVNMKTGVCPYRMQPRTCLSRPTSASRRLLKECACFAPFARH